MCLCNYVLRLGLNYLFSAISSPVGMRSPTMGSNLIMISPRPERTSMLMTSQQNQEDSNMSEKG